MLCFSVGLFYEGSSYLIQKNLIVLIETIFFLYIIMSMLKCLVTHNTKIGPYALVLLRNVSGSSFTHAYATVFEIKIFPRDGKPPGDHIKTIASSYMENILTAPV